MHLNLVHPDSATGKEYREVPYSQEHIRVDGLSPGVNFCNTRMYNRQHLEFIVQAEKSITFVSSAMYAHDCMYVHPPFVHVDYSLVLNKPLGEVC